MQWRQRRNKDRKNDEVGDRADVQNVYFKWPVDSWEVGPRFFAGLLTTQSIMAFNNNEIRIKSSFFVILENCLVLLYL